MSFLLTLIFAGAVIYLWRRFEVIEEKVRLLDQSVDALSLQLSRNVIDTAAPVIKAPSAQDPAYRPAQPRLLKPGLPDEELGSAPAPSEAELEAETEARPAPTAIPATRKEPEEAAVSQALPNLEGSDSAEADVDHEEQSSFRFEFDFEDFFGRLLPIWAGGIALAVAGFFLVRYSIEQGLLGPQVRVALGFLFGGVLLGGAELAYRQEQRVSDPRVRQALAGAGLATLYASFYLAGSQYGLIGSAVAFLGLAGVTGSAILLSFRFGLPSAILGLVGGFSAPMLVASENPNLPILALYLALVTGGLTYAGNRQGRSWLALAALAGGLGWGMLMLVSGVTGTTDILAFGGYITVLGAILPTFAKVGDFEGAATSRFLRLGAAALAAIQMGVMVSEAGFNLLAWGLYGLLAAMLAFFAWREPRLREACAFAAGLGIVMLGIWPNPSTQDFILVGAAMLVLFGYVPLANIWRGEQRNLDAFQLTGSALGLIIFALGQLYGAVGDTTKAAITLAITIVPILASWKQWPAREEPVPAGALASVAASAIGVSIAGLILTPLWAAPLVMAAVALGVIALAWHRNQRGLAALAWVMSMTSVLALPLYGFGAEVGLLFGIEEDVDVARALLRWTAVTLPFIAIALKDTNVQESIVAQIFASLFVYGIFAQVVPDNALAWTAAGLAIATGFIALKAFATRITFSLVALAWALEPILLWTQLAITAASGVEPMLSANTIGFEQIGLRMLPILVVLASLLLRPGEAVRDMRSFIAVPSGLIAAIAAHMAFKHILVIETAEQFVVLGLVERTLWQGILLAGGLLVARFATQESWSRPARTAFFAGALAHFTLFTLFWHNPLWDEQAVGSVPILNLLLPTYGLAIVATAALKRLSTAQDAVPSWLFDAVVMGLISLFTLSELRHVFAGSILSQGMVGSTEDLLRSVLGIVLAIGFLLWAARANSRSWRIGSLVLMLIAVLKVFILDASALDGLLRVASFIALGLSLIGIGWFYTRQLAGMRGLA